MHDFEILNLTEQNRSLEARVAQLEAYQAYRKHYLSLNEGAVIVKTKNGLASITLKASGDVVIDCKDFEVKASGKIELKGAKVSQN